ITDEGMDMVVASRLIEGGGVVGNLPQKRRLNSYVATLMAKPLTSVLDSMSGCFLLRKQVIENVKLVPRGYKIGLEILVKGNCPKVGEIPILFDNRMTGTSKLSPKTQFEYMIQIGCLYAHKIKKMILRKH
ncbi:glycosyltransferase family 2 protein, partial [bacterium]|nr:glycosyltransferase family 2 protein [bacterium]